MSRILLSCYSLNPNLGSENIIGWNWLITYLIYNNKIFLVTNSRNKEPVERNLRKLGINQKKISIIYIKDRFSIFSNNLFIENINYLIWQIESFFTIKKNYGLNFFDKIHHVTWSTIRFNSLLHFFNTNFILGPICGAEFTESFFISRMPIRYRLIEYLKIFNNIFYKLINFNKILLKNASLIILTSNENYFLIPKKYHIKTMVMSSVGTSLNDRHHIKVNKPQTIYKFVYVGRILSWKGICLFIDILFYMKKYGTCFIFDIYGNGAYKNFLDTKIKKLKLTEHIKLKGYLNHNLAKKIYLNYNFNILTSHRDSGGNSIIESNLCSTPSIVLDKYGPGCLVSKYNGIKLKIDINNYDEFIKNKANELNKILQDKNFYKNLNFDKAIKTHSFNIKYNKILNFF